MTRNTWGDGWGEGGYAKVSREYVNKFFDEAYGVYILNSREAGKAAGEPHKPSGFPKLWPPLEDLDDDG